MNTLLIPTDFSPVADNALRYGIAMAGAYNLDLTLYHVVQFTPPNLAHVVYVDDTPQMTKEAEQKMQEKMAALQTEYPEIRFHTRVDTGFLIESLKTVCEEIQPVAVIMGLTGEGTVVDKIIGSNAILAMQNLKNPLLIVPKKCEFKPVANICFASDLRKVANSTPAVAIRVFAKLFGATLHVLNIDNANRASDPAVAAELGHLRDMFSDTPHAFHFLEQADVQDAIQDFIQKENMDLLILLPKKYSWFESLFHKSQSKEMAYHSHVPMLTLHMD